MRVIGIDPSLTRTAIAIIDDDLPYHEVRELPTKGSQNATLAERSSRLRNIAQDATDWMLSDRFEAPDLVVIEQPAFSRTTGSHHDRSGLWWLIVQHCVSEFQSPIVEVSPTSLKTYVTGKGNAGKDEMLLAAAKRYGDAFPAETNDGCDAFCLAAMGARHLGHPIEDLPRRTCGRWTRSGGRHDRDARVPVTPPNPRGRTGGRGWARVPPADATTEDHEGDPMKTPCPGPDCTDNQPALLEVTA